METLKAGGETSAYCTSCKDMRHHVIVAMEANVPAKVECLSCHKQHRYKAGPPGTKVAKAEGGKRVKTPLRAALAPAASGPHPLDLLLASRETVTTRAYSPAERYAVGELVSHPSFGLGAVMGVPSPGKISVLFRDATRLLLHERSGHVVALPSKLSPPPRREELPHGPAERPPKVKPLL